MRKIIEIPVGDLMSAPALTVKPETTIDELTRLFAEHEFNGLPVVNDLRVLVGIVTQLDLFKLHLLPYPRFVPVLENAWVSSVDAVMARDRGRAHPHRLRPVPRPPDRDDAPELTRISRVVRHCAESTRT